MTRATSGAADGFRRQCRGGGRGFNVFAIKEGGCCSPPTPNVLDGMTRRTVFELAGELNLEGAAREGFAAGSAERRRGLPLQHRRRHHARLLGGQAFHRRRQAGPDHDAAAQPLLVEARGELHADSGQLRHRCGEREGKLIRRLALRLGVRPSADYPGNDRPRDGRPHLPGAARPGRRLLAPSSSGCGSGSRKGARAGSADRPEGRCAGGPVRARGRAVARRTSSAWV